jgi:hypothetical protein
MRMKMLAAAAVLAAVAGNAAAETPMSMEREGAVMLYFNKPLGHSRSASARALTFGLRLDQVSTLSSRSQMSLFDARLSLSGHTTLAAMGVPMFDSALEGRRWFASFSSSRLDPWAVVGLGLLGAGAVACLAEFGICESSDDDDGEGDY